MASKPKVKSHVVRLYNSSKQMIPIQVKAPGADFFSQQQVRIEPGKSVLLAKSHLLMEQIENLQKRRMLKILHDSEVADERAANESL